MDPRSQPLGYAPPIASLADSFRVRSESILTTDTRVQLWDIDVPGRQDDVLGSAALREKLAGYASFWEDHGNTANIKIPTSRFVLFTVLGQTMFGKSTPATLEIRRDVLSYLIQTAGFCHTTTQKFFTTLTPYCHTYLQYDAEDDETPAYTSLIFRCPRNSDCVVCTIRIQMATRNCFVFLACNSTKDVQSIRSYCATNVDSLKIHPLYLLSYIFEYRYHTWADWFGGLWTEVVEVETVMNTSSSQWKIKRMNAERFKALSQPEVLLNQIHTTHLELCHCHTVMLFALRFGKFCTDAVVEMEERCQDLGFRKLSMRHRSGLLESFSVTAERCDSMANRLSELRSRLSQNINVSYQLIAQKDSRTNLAIARLTARDSQTVKGIAILTLLFLPSTLIATLWTTNLFKLEGDTNWQVYLTTSLVLTFVVFVCWWIYGRVTRPPESTSDDLSLYSPGRNLTSWKLEGNAWAHNSF
ncbi:hypothetical protein AK830_g9613 [Neonectria ditissima]|uniref:Uncharacterized protein n=1 Tax=Neonectria ditissima TaxID=78410 RepID=A0A0N8H5S0_9HYPO|nr:hypothetical protein AK830_g9613 [Neonectria ditissima]